MRIVITVLAEHAWVIETESVDVHVGARAGLARDRNGDIETVPWRSSPGRTGADGASAAVRDAANAIAPV
jgi:hypothetical protein